MSTEDAKDDISMLLIAKKADYGLAPRKWRASLNRSGLCLSVKRAQPYAWRF